MTQREVRKEIKRVYPVTEMEKECWQEKQRRDELRKILKKRLEDENMVRESLRSSGAS